MNLRKIVCGGALLAGLAGLLGCDNDVKKNDVKKNDVGYVVEDESGNEYRVFMGDPAPKFWSNSIWSRPSELTGISAEISIIASDEGKNAGISKLILYEDGHEIFSSHDSIEFGGKYESSVGVPIKHNKPGIHEYQAEVIDKGGNKVKSGPITLEFTGKLLDLPPSFSGGGIFVDNDGDLCIWAKDEGDNKGLKEVLLYADGSVIKKFECEDAKFWASIPLTSLHKEGKHTYFAELVDNGDNAVRSKTITVNYEM